MSRSTDLALVESTILDTREAFEARLTDRSLNFDSEAGFALQLLSKSDYALGVALKQQQSVVNAVTNVAAIGLSLNPALKHAYLVPRKDGNGVVQILLDVSYMGLVELAMSCGAIRLAQAKLVHEGDARFIDNGPGLAPTHEYDPRSKSRGPVACVYVAAKLPSGDWHTEIMTVDDINAIRDRSDAYKAVQSGRAKSCPWTTDWEEMAKKTVAKRASKWWRGGDGRLEKAIHYLNTDGGEGLANVDGRAADVTSQAAGFDPDAWIRKAQATKTEAELTAVYGQAMEAAAVVRDKPGAVRFKQAALAHREVLRNNTIDMPEAA